MKKLVALLLPLMLLACSDPYGACEKAAADIGTGIGSGMMTINGLRTSGLITSQEEISVLGFMKFANDANGAFASCAQQAHNAGSKKGAFTACAQTFQTTLSNPTELALIRVTNPQAQQQVQTVVNAVTTGVATVITTLGGA
jgi:hypothetical protein